MHARSQIRQALIVLLEQHPELSGRVFEAPFVASKAKMPAIVVAMGGETVDRLDVHPNAVCERRCQLLVDVIVGHTADSVFGESDRYILAVEKAVFASETSSELGGLLPAGLQLTGLDASQDNQSIERALKVTATFDGIYFTTQGNPELIS